MPAKAILHGDAWLMVIPVKEVYPILDVARILGITSSQCYTKLRYNSIAHILVQPIGYRRPQKAIEHAELLRYIDHAKSDDQGGIVGEATLEPFDGY
jgi:hypothetical protein